MLRLLFPKAFKSQQISVILKPICEHNPKAQSTVYPDTQGNWNEVHQNLEKQIKQNFKQKIKNQYDNKRSN